MLLKLDKIIKNDPISLQKRMQKFFIDGESHKLILKVASKNFKKRHFLTLNLVMNLVMVMHAHLTTSKMVLFIYFIQILSNRIDL